MSGFLLGKKVFVGLIKLYNLILIVNNNHRYVITPAISIKCVFNTIRIVYENSETFF